MRLLLLLRSWMVGRVLLGRFEWFRGLLAWVDGWMMRLEGSFPKSRVIDVPTVGIDFLAASYCSIGPV
jgi:hypothetical protein